MIAEVPTALRDRQLAVVDAEGNGRRPTPEIIEIAIVPVDGAVVGPDNIRCRLLQPLNRVNPVVTQKMHGIRESDVADCPLWAQIEPSMGAALSGRVLVAHNATVERHLSDWEPPVLLNTLQLAKAVSPGVPCNGLDGLVDHAAPDTTAVGFGAPEGRAMDPVRADS